MTAFRRWIIGNRTFLLIMLALGMGFLALKSSPTQITGELDAALASGQPVILDFYSNL